MAETAAGSEELLPAAAAADGEGAESVADSISVAEADDLAAADAAEPLLDEESSPCMHQQAVNLDVTDAAIIKEGADGGASYAT